MESKRKKPIAFLAVYRYSGISKEAPGPSGYFGNGGIILKASGLSHGLFWTQWNTERSLWSFWLFWTQWNK